MFYDNLRLLFGAATLLFLSHPTLHSAYIHMVNWRLCTVTLPFIAVWDTAFSDGREWSMRFQNLALMAGRLRPTPAPLSQWAGLLYTFTPAWFLFVLPAIVLPRSAFFIATEASFRTAILFLLFLFDMMLFTSLLSLLFVVTAVKSAPVNKSVYPVFLCA